MVPVIAEAPLLLQADPTPHENLHTRIPTECVVGLIEAEEEFVEDLIPHFCQLPKKLGFEGYVPSSSTRPEVMEDIVKLYCCPDPPFDKP